MDIKNINELYKETMSLKEKVFKLNSNNIINSENHIKEFIIDYYSKYYFYEEEEFKNKFENADTILDYIKSNGRYNTLESSFTFSKYGNIAESKTKTHVNFSIILDSENVIINNEEKYLDLNYKCDIKYLEDHLRLTTKINDNSHLVSCILYINYAQAEDFINSIEYVKNIQKKYINLRSNNILN